MESFFDHTNHEIYLVSSLWQNKRYGFIATWVMPLTLKGPQRRFVIAISPLGASWQAILHSKTVGLQMLCQGQEHCVVPFGCTSSRDHDKFIPCDLEQKTSLPFLKGSMGCIEATLISHHPCQDRILAVCQTLSFHTPGPHTTPIPLTTSYLKHALSPQELQQLKARKHELAQRSLAST